MNNTSEKPSKGVIIAVAAIIAIVLIIAVFNIITGITQRNELRDFLEIENGWVDININDETYYLKFEDNVATLSKETGLKSYETVKEVEYKITGKDTLKIRNVKEWVEVDVFTDNNGVEGSVSFYPCIFDMFYHANFEPAK